MMYQPYNDLHELAGYEEPKWWDEQGVPRWCEFHPDKANNIYADEVALVEIACQGCGRRLRVALATGRYETLVKGKKTLAQQVGERTTGYGDAPCFRFPDGKLEQCAGSAMPSDAIRVVEFWSRTGECYSWERKTELEVCFQCQG